MNRQERSDAYAREDKSRIIALLYGHHPEGFLTEILPGVLSFPYLW